MNPQDVPFRGLATSKGPWGIFVQSVVEAQNGENLFLTMVLEQCIDDERIRSRKLAIAVPILELASSIGQSRILNQIRNWIETTEGDGSVDGTSQSS